ncbi:MAG: hypothetical protein JSS98_05650 [Bacteroidetes bacterium]|nr:hypothetical protein [Bacteroidota bacterium]
MTSQQLITASFRRLKKYWVILFGLAAILGAALTFYAMRQPVTYTSNATIFPLTAGSDNNNSVLSALMGTSDNSKNFTDDASINIIELAQSRATREEVANIRDSSQGNKTIAELLLKDVNDHRGFMEKKVELSAGSDAALNWAINILKGNLSASINKNNSFVLNYTARSPEMARLVSYGFIDKISSFYIDLKREKAKRDYEFATGKVDSLRSVMDRKDNQLIAIDQRTLFTNTSKLQFRVPTENLLADKQMIRQQYATAIANQQNASYKLQKATPVIKVLDKPEPPYDVQSKSPLMYGLVGFFGGIFIISLFLVANLLLRYVSFETRKAIFGNEASESAAA